MDYSKVRATWWTGNVYHKEQLDAIISSHDVKSYAYILHDKDLKDDGTGELKKPHYHYLIHLDKSQRGSWFKQFETDDMGLVFRQPCRVPENAYAYLIHDTDTCRKQKKFLYPESERISTIDSFDIEQKEDEHLELFFDLMELLHHNISWLDLIKKKPKRIHMIANIKVAYDLLFFEMNGYRYWEQNNPNFRPNLNRLPRKEHRQDLPPIEQPKPTQLPPPTHEHGMRVLSKEEEDGLPW